MLRPERMSKVSVTGAKPVMDDVIEAVHGLHLLHLSAYDGSWEGFERGAPAEGADDASQKLVTVRSLRSTLGVAEAEPAPVDDLEGELESVRQRTNDLDDRRSEIEDELRSVEERIEALAPFRKLTIDLDLLEGFRTLETAVGRGDADAVRTAVAETDALGEYEVRTSDDGEVVAVFARPAGATVVGDGDDEGGAHLEEALVGVEFEPVEAPEYDEANPRVETRTLRERAEELRSDLAEVEAEMDDLSAEVGGFLVAAENRLTVEVQKAEAPLSFATTENSFVAEGWIPTDRVDEMGSALERAVGDRVEFEELRVAEYDEGHPDRVEEVEPDPDPDPSRERKGGGEPTPAPDGGVVTMRDPPPTTLDNPTGTKSAETLVKAIGLPKYSEFDPTAIVFLTFPVFFGFMIGDLGYGLLYMGIGYAMYSRLDSEALRSLGGLGMWAGLFTAIFGVLYGEFFGLHALGEIVWEGPIGAAVGIEHTPIHKGLQPEYSAFATAWLLLSLAVGLLHVGLGYVLGFLEDLSGHGLKEALLENGSWLLLMFGAWAWVFSTSAEGVKPEFIYTAFASGEEAALALGFTGLPETIGLVGLGAVGLGFVMLVAGEGLLAVEVLQALVNVLSYVRLMAVLLAKAGLAFVVNLLVFGAVETEKGEFHFISVEGYSDPATHGEVMFQGLFNAGDGAVAIVGLVAGVVLLVVGHLFVLALGVTSAGLQGVRLEYVEFFGKFYDGGGRTYDPFGHSGDHTTED